MPVVSGHLKKMLIHANLVVFPEDYIAVYLPIGIKTIPGEWFRPATTRFAAVIQEPKLLTMIIPRRKWLRMQNMFEKYDVSGPFKTITFDVKNSLTASGFRAAIASVMDEASISCIPISSFKRYHIVVPKADLPRTVKAIRRFLDSVKKRQTGSSKKA